MKKYVIKLILVCAMAFIGVFGGCGKAPETPVREIDLQRIANYNMNKDYDEFSLTMREGREFVILNLTDIQLDVFAWKLNGPSYNEVKSIIAYLIDKTDPDLITFTGDMSYGSPDAYRIAVDLFDSFGVYWAPVLGNHDHNKGEEKEIAKIFSAGKYCLFEAGNSDLGTGNYIVKLVDSDNNLKELLVFMDTHDRADGGWAHLTQEQFDWYEQKINKYSSADNVVDSTVFIHIPIYAYNYALQNAINCDEPFSSRKFDRFCKDMPLSNEGNLKYWKEGYTSSFGVRWELPCTPEKDDGAFSVFKRLGSTHNIVSGHDHSNNVSILYDGIRLTYGMKSSYESYYSKELIGGTVLTVKNNNINDVYHVYWDKQP